jgi:WhiB family redox-sensing transcriptional regulator
VADLFINPPDWSAAECSGLTHLFFTEVGETQEPAKAVCRDCPIRQACLEYALDNGETHGIWGGLSPRERRAYRRRHPRPRRLVPIIHGTTSGYALEIRRQLTPCDACRRANNVATRESRERRKEAGREIAS